MAERGKPRLVINADSLSFVALWLMLAPAEEEEFALTSIASVVSMTLFMTSGLIIAIFRFKRF